MRTALITLLLVASAAAHLCLLSPLQRAPANNFNGIGASDCGLITGPCGGAAQLSPVVFLEAGTNFTVVFQKNENHWVAATPGNFTISMIYPGSRPVVLATLPDVNTPSLSLFPVPIKVPSTPTKAGVLQVVYNTGNPNAPPQFYQCADIGIF